MYDNLLKAMGKTSDSGLTYEEQSENYKVFSDLMKQGVRLQDLVDKANAPKEPSIDAELFSVMENAVDDVLEVKIAKKLQNETLKCILERFAESDPEYQRVSKAYRDAVMKAYTEKKEAPAEK